VEEERGNSDGKFRDLFARERTVRLSVASVEMTFFCGRMGGNNDVLSGRGQKK